MALDDYLNQINRNLGRAPRNQTIADAFYGFSTVGRNPPIHGNTEDRGFTFFTRPTMNLSYDNVAADRVLANLLSEDPRSVSRMIRMTLDPILRLEGLECPGIDHNNSFIPILSNNLISLSGWPDFTLNTHTTNPGIYRESMSYVDDIPYNYESFELQATFRNIAGDPITFMMLMWGWYMGLVYEGRLMPYPDAVLSNYLDYNTRIYRIITDASKTYVTRMGAVGAAFPNTAPIGNIFNFEGDGSESPYQTVNDRLTFNFRCDGFIFYDNILIYEFNQVVQTGNYNMRDDRRERTMQKLNKWEQEYFAASVYPRVNPETLELEWWIDKRLYEAEALGILRSSTPVIRTS